MKDVIVLFSQTVNMPCTVSLGDIAERVCNRLFCLTGIIIVCR